MNWPQNTKRYSLIHKAMLSGFSSIHHKVKVVYVRTGFSWSQRPSMFSGTWLALPVCLILLHGPLLFVSGASWRSSLSLAEQEILSLGLQLVLHNMLALVKGPAADSLKNGSEEQWERISLQWAQFQANCGLDSQDL